MKAVRLKLSKAGKRQASPARRSDVRAMQSDAAPPMRQSEKVRSELEDMIVSGEIAPGSKLDEETLAARFGVSRTPIREALMQLAATGLLRTRPRQTATVAKLTVKDILESFEFNTELESIAAGMAARRMTVQQRFALRGIVDRMRSVAKRGDIEAYVRLNREFHTLLHAGSHNRHVETQAKILFARLAPFRRQVLFRPGQVAISLRQHQEIVEAIVVGDDTRAAQVMRAHTSVKDQAFLDVLSTIARSHED